MPFTPDHQLELQFDPLLIPPAAREGLHPDLHVRPLALTDYSRGHLRVLSVLSPAPDIGPVAYARQFHYVRQHAGTYFTLCIIDKRTDMIVATGTIIIEQKFVHSVGRAGHLEDVAVDKAEQRQGRRVGLSLVRALLAISDSQGCYKCVGNTAARNFPFYEKLGFTVKEHEMARYPAQLTGCKL
ncbi:acyl-CoA N-acyltransferase [Auricularia subglabra TFB-10046 SS5]|nr:acyl-CoA N-acyltransferase [Auricularia subglabra TFB-10046 SS5]